MFKFITEDNCKSLMSRDRQCLSGIDYDRFSALSPEQKSNLLLLLLEVLTRHKTTKWVKFKSALLYILIDFKERADIAIIAKKVSQEPKRDTAQMEAREEKRREGQQLLAKMAELAIPEDFPHDRAMYWLRSFYLRLREVVGFDPGAFAFCQEVDALVQAREDKKKMEAVVTEMVRPTSIIKKPKVKTK